MEFLDNPDKDGFYGTFGGAFVPECLKAEFENITAAFLNCKKDVKFHAELSDLYTHYVGRPSPVYFAKNLSRKYGADLYLKREDLNHTGAHKINHCLGEALLAKRMGKKKLIAEKVPDNTVSRLQRQPHSSGSNAIFTWGRWMLPRKSRTWIA